MSSTKSNSAGRYGWFTRFVFPPVRLLFSIQLKRAGGRKFWQPIPVKIDGSPQLPKGPVLIVANHQSDIDPPLVQYCVSFGFGSRGIHFMGKAELFEMKFWGPAIRFFHAFPLHKDRTDTAAIKHCLRLLELGECVCIFPEGGITAGDGIYPLERGLTLLLRRANPQVVCVGLSGTKSFMSGGSMDLGKSNTEITIRWGEPKQFGEFAGDAALDEIRRILSELSGLPLKDP